MISMSSGFETPSGNGQERDVYLSYFIFLTDEPQTSNAVALHPLHHKAVQE
jgi:hypothetical protein